MIIKTFFKKFYMNLRFTVCALLGVTVLCFSCSKDKPQPAPKQGAFQAKLETHSDLAAEPGELPIWIEFNSSGISQIDTPDKAALKPFEPWPYMQHITGMVSFENGVFVFVNRLGFLRIEPVELYNELLEIFVYAEKNYFSRWTASSPFIYGGYPYVVMSANDYFSVESIEPPSVNLRVWTVDTDLNKAFNVRFPAFNVFPDGEGWDIKEFWTAEDGYHYFKAAKTKSESKIMYLKSKDPGSAELSEEISFSAFMQGSSPVHFSSAGVLMSAVLKEAFGADNKKTSHIAAVFSMATGASSQYIDSAPAVVGDDQYTITEFGGVSGSFLNTNTGEIQNYACVINREGDLFIAGNSAAETGGSPVVVQSKKMPSLPEGFVYTHAFLCGGAIAAAWEEREDWNIGAAGLMLIKSQP
ncbi:hypothetical protein AGMMS50212_04140 [Spirochaetia bacterium]|nr:hypothetical protein AGMMS50212_04140 [Spirochaetia bacterium]